MAVPMIYTQLNKVMKDLGSVSKDQRNQAQGFSFRGVDQFVNALNPALIKNEVVMSTEVLDYDAELRDVERNSGKKGIDKHVKLKVKYTFYASDGSSLSSTMVSEGLDSGDKATPKALSAALKYMLIQTFSVPTIDMAEGDSDSPTIERTITPTPSGTEQVGTNGAVMPSEPQKVAKVYKSFRKIGPPKATASATGTSGSDMDI